MSKNNIAAQIAGWIIQQRHKKNWSQSEMSRQTSINRTLINKYEQGARRDFNLRTLHKLAEAFGCELVVQFRRKA